MFNLIKNLFKKANKPEPKKEKLSFVVVRHYPIKERKDFFKYAIIKSVSIWHPNNKNLPIEKNFKGELLAFDCENKAKEVAAAKNKILSIKEYRKNNPLYSWD